MKASKETKILAILLALFLLIGIGCGVAVATSGHSNGYLEPKFIDVTLIATTEGTFVVSSSAEASALVESAVYYPEKHPDAWFNPSVEVSGSTAE